MSGNVSRVTGCRCNETLNPMCECCWGNRPASGDGPRTLCMTIALFGLCAVERAHASCVRECKSSKNTPDVGEKGRRTENLACNSRNISEYPKAKITTEFLPLGQGIWSEAPSRGSLGTLGALGTWSETLEGSQMLA